MKSFSYLCAFVVLAIGVAAMHTSKVHSQEQQEKRVAKISDIMKSINRPNSQQLTRASRGEAPTEDEVWDRLRMIASMMNEAGHMLDVEGRKKDAVWMEATAALRSSTTAVADAAANKDFEAFKSAAATVGGACQTCHVAHRK